MMIVFNPVAGRRRAQLLWRVLDVLVANGVRLDLAETHRPGHASELAREAASRGEPMVVAAGGDGTIAEVANGLIGSHTHLGVIPLGTANVLAHELGLPFSPTAVAAALAFGRTVQLWPGQIMRDQEARLFVQMAGIGFDAAVVHNLRFSLKKVFGKGAYVMQSLREMARYDFPMIRLRIDDRETEAASIVISKGRLYGGTFPLARDTNPSARGFSVVLFDRAGPAAAALYGAMLPMHLLGSAPGVRHMRAAEIDFLGNVHVPTQTDGDPAGFMPHRIRDARAPIQVVAG
ncbi:diacylglycerol/lipid kinase family protein [Rhodopila sp.]|jgi:YegS/Rv2252/BmrU family lipid kinase|uniref:diacylglycerol/lipid kinase family protein n=1 Tax=Rhodopila sp. TaxID=2480087 RepID=UPI002CE440FD|nr:diacylglycerol kinase family protein [Rhodopila sp.]HVZ06398.1 diacylglycerol kinase family protein [Rhodopila sp.]